MSRLENTFQKTSPPVTDDDLDEIESSCRFTFPPDFRAHYLKYNGGRPERNVFHGEGVECVIQNFLPIKHAMPGFSVEDTLRFEDVFKNLSLPEIIDGEVIADAVFPSHLIAFAKDPGGDFFCFSTRQKDYGAIYYFIGEYAITDPPRAVTLLLGSLHEFLDRLEAD